MISEYVPRLVGLSDKLQRRSHFFFGPRQTGKSTLIRHELADAIVYDLLDSDVYLALSRRPALLREEVPRDSRLVVVDEIQKLPSLLDEVHLMMEERGTRFLLTGSSARKLRRGGVNLLGGRARSLTLHPFSVRELPDFELMRALNWGLLPPVYLSEEPEQDLKAYVGNYLVEEVAAEGLTRNIPAFSRFLEVAALCNGKMLNHSKIANDAQVARSTVQEYFGILKDTLIAHTLPAWRRSSKRKPIVSDKFYFFDNGVVRRLQNQGIIQPRSPAFGEAFETFLFHELKCFSDYGGNAELRYWRSTSNFEVDFVISDTTAVEVKGKQVIGASDLRGLRAIREEGLLRHHVLVAMVDRPRLVDGIAILPWRQFIDRLWAGEFTP